MADAVSAASGVLAILSFSLQAGRKLYELIETFRKHDRIVRDLKADLGGLTVVLADLSEAIQDTNQVPESSTLKVPLFSCGQICEEFGTLIHSCTRRTKDAGISVRDWSALRLHADQINAFRVSLSGYKTTMLLSLGLENLRSAQVTANCMAEFRDMIEEAKSDLKESLQRFDPPTSVAPADAAAYLAWITSSARAEEEKKAILVCLNTCDEVWADIARQQRYVMHTIAGEESQEGSAAGMSTAISSGHLMTSALDQCQSTVGSTRKELQGRLNAIPGLPGSAHVREQEHIKKCLTFCDHVMNETTKINVYEDFSAGDNSRQYMVSTVGALISAKRVDFGSRSITVSGQMSDETLQMALKAFGPESVTTTATQASSTSNESTFERYGQGHPLRSRAGKP